MVSHFQAPFSLGSRSSLFCCVTPTSWWVQRDSSWYRAQRGHRAHSFRGVADTHTPLSGIAAVVATSFCHSCNPGDSLVISEAQVYSHSYLFTHRTPFRSIPNVFTPLRARTLRFFLLFIKKIGLMKAFFYLLPPRMCSVNSPRSMCEQHSWSFYRSVNTCLSCGPVCHGLWKWLSPGF